MTKLFTIPSTQVSFRLTPRPGVKYIYFVSKYYTIDGKRIRDKYLIGTTYFDENNNFLYFEPNASYRHLFDENGKPLPLDYSIYTEEMYKYKAALIKAKRSDNPVFDNSKRINFLIKALKRTKVKNSNAKVEDSTSKVEDSVSKEEVKEKVVINPKDIIETTDYSKAVSHEILNEKFNTNSFIDQVYYIANKFNLIKILSSIWSPEVATKIINWAAFCIYTDKYNATHNFNLFAKEMNLSERWHMSSQRFSEFFMSFEVDKMELFYKELAAFLKETSAIYLDFSNITTYSNNLKNAAWGKSKTGERLKQVNLAVGKGTRTHLPIFLEIYRGNVNDSSYLKRAGEIAKKSIPKIEMIVMDQGAASKENLKYLEDLGINVVTILKSKTIAHRTILAKANSMGHANLQLLEGSTEYYYQEIINYADSKYKAVAVYSADKAAVETKTILRDKNKEVQDVEKLGRQLPIKPSSMRFHTFKVKSRGECDAEYSKAKFKNEVDAAGWFVLITNNTSLVPEQIRLVYTLKSNVERTFRSTKTGIGYERLLASNDKVLEGKMFCGLVADFIFEIIERIVPRIPKKFESGDPVTVSNFVKYLAGINVDDVISSNDDQFTLIKAFSREIDAEYVALEL